MKNFLRRLALRAMCYADHHDLVHELRARGFPTIIWTPEDMEGFGDSKMSLEDRLSECAKSLEDRLTEVGWDVISSILGNNDTED